MCPRLLVHALLAWGRGDRTAQAAVRSGGAVTVLFHMWPSLLVHLQAMHAPCQPGATAPRARNLLWRKAIRAAGARRQGLPAHVPLPSGGHYAHCWVCGHVPEAGEAGTGPERASRAAAARAPGPVGSAQRGAPARPGLATGSRPAQGYFAARECGGVPLGSVQVHDPEGRMLCFKLLLWPFFRESRRRIRRDGMVPLVVGENLVEGPFQKLDQRQRRFLNQAVTNTPLEKQSSF